MKTLMLTGFLMIAASASFADVCQGGDAAADASGQIQSPSQGTLVDSQDVDSKNLYQPSKPAEQTIPAGARDTNT